MEEEIYTVIGYLPTQITNDENYDHKNYVMSGPNTFSSVEKSLKLPSNSIITSAKLYTNENFEKIGLHHEQYGELLIIKENLVNWYESVFKASSVSDVMFNRFCLIDEEIIEDQTCPELFIEYTILKTP
mgnify:CR=1 FL=1